MTVRVLIVDDEVVARRRIRRLLAAERDIVLVGECGDGASALKTIVADKPHIVFLDVQMPELDGFEVVRALAPEELPGVVFVTAFDRYALRAFDVHAVDYLLKPFTRDRFQTALSRARGRLDTPRTGLTDHLAPLMDDVGATRPPAARVVVRTGDRFVVIAWDQVDWIEAADNYVTLHVGTREHLLRQTLAALVQQLDPDRFVRVHRSSIVQADRIAELLPGSHGDAEVVLRDGTRVTVSRTWRKNIERLLRGGAVRRP
jgi:two-component system LytT family response regulator